MAETRNTFLQFVTTYFQNFSERISVSCYNFILRVLESYQNFRQRTSERIQRCLHPPPPVFTEEDLEEYMALTYLSKEEILRAYKHFCSMQPQFFVGQKNPYLPRRKVMDMPEFKVNPFRTQMMFAISSFEDFLTFENYLEMMSVFSEQAPIELKAEYAFRIYDFSFDDLISIDDLVRVVKKLKEDSDQELDEGYIEKVAIQTLLDGDVDGDGFLAFVEFLHLIKRLEDFKSSFIIRI